jgi:hypothetical protein
VVFPSSQLDVAFAGRPLEKQRWVSAAALTPRAVQRVWWHHPTTALTSFTRGAAQVVLSGTARTRADV